MLLIRIWDKINSTPTNKHLTQFIIILIVCLFISFFRLGYFIIRLSPSQPLFLWILIFIFPFFLSFHVELFCVYIFSAIYYCLIAKYDTVQADIYIIKYINKYIYIHTRHEHEHEHDGKDTHFCLLNLPNLVNSLHMAYLPKA